jgi:glyoxylase-like metal-dependent hydrolase (beta-lactamase superfamily II)
MNFGDLELHLFMASHWKADGGMMFGVVPKILWEKQKPADHNNMIDVACVCLVARLNGKVIVCETGIGTKLNEKRAQQVVLREPEGLLHSLHRLGIRPEEVDAVITTHLHWDHAGGLTRRDAEGGLSLTFPKARHFIQKSEWDFALHPDVRSQTGYIADDFTPLEDGNQMVEFLSGDAEVMPGVEIRHVGGHTPGSQVLILRSGELACAVTGDLVCQTPHLRVPWTMSADLDALRLLDEKARLLEEAEKHRWLLVLSHDPDQPAGYIESGHRWRPEPRLT